MFISVLIPVYKSSDMLPHMLEKLAKDAYPKKEILVTVDQPDPKMQKMSRRFKNVKFFFNGQRIGKARALNELVKHAKGDVLLFLDADVMIKQHDFLSRIARDMDGTDILDIKKKTFRTSFLTKLVAYDYLCGNIVSFISSKERKSTWLCGAAFAIRKKVFEQLGGFKGMISEDFELAMDCFLKKKRYKLSEGAEVYTCATETLRLWLKQRKRWSVGFAEHIKCRWKDYLKGFRIAPKLIVKLALYFLWPLFVIGLGLSFVDGVFERAAATIIFMLSIKFTNLVPFVLLTGFGFILVRNVLLFLLVYSISAMLHFTFAKKFNMEFSPFEYVIYYFIYMPFQTIVYLYYMLKTFLGYHSLLDWKI